MFVLPQVGAAFAIYSGYREEREKDRLAVAAAYYAGAVIWGMAALAGTLYCAYKVYRAYHALP